MKVHLSQGSNFKATSKATINAIDTSNTSNVKTSHREGCLWLGPRLVGRMGSGVRVTFGQINPQASGPSTCQSSALVQTRYIVGVVGRVALFDVT